MIPSTKVRRLLLALPVVAMTSVVLVGEAAAYQCHGRSQVADATGPRKTLAQALAVSAWSVSVKNRFGLAWSQWSIASSKSVRCQPYGQGWRCTVGARPCKYVVQ